MSCHGVIEIIIGNPHLCSPRNEQDQNFLKMAAILAELSWSLGHSCRTYIALEQAYKANTSKIVIYHLSLQTEERLLWRLLDA